MASFKLGSYEIPIYRHVEFPGEPGNNPQISLSDLAPVDMFEFGVQIGNGTSESNYHNPDAQGSTYASISGGTTGIHGGEVVFTVTERAVTSDKYGPWLDGNILVRVVEEESSIQIDTSTITVNNQMAPRYLRAAERRSAFAISFSYPDAAAEKDRVKGYFIFTVRNLREWNPVSGNLTADQYTFDSSAIGKINIPYYNKTRNLELYYDDEPTPEPDEDPNEDDPDYPSEPSTPDQDHTPIYDPIPIPNLPTLGSAGAGFITMYKLGLAAINQFTGDMFVDTVWEAIKNYFGQPMDFLVGCMLLPFEPETGSSYYPKFGDDIKFAHAYPAVSNQYKEIDCGTVFIKKYWGSCFDYEPFTKIQIWLPYIGYRDLAVDEIMGNSISVKYHCDCLTGDCVAFVLDNLGPEVGPTIPRVIAQFYGNCGVRVPFGSVSYDSAVAAGISLIGSAASNALIPGAAPAIEGIKGNGGIVGGAAAGAQAFGEAASSHSSSLVGSTVNFVQSMKPTVQKGGAAGASNGYMSIQKPYLIRRVPRQNLPADYIKFKGYPSNISGKLADFSGYAEIDDIQLNDIPAMSIERAEIISWLNGGVLI